MLRNNYEPILHIPDVVIDGKPYYYPKKVRRSVKNQTRLSTMGRELYCDLCRVSVPIEENLQKVIIGGSTLAEVCLTDAQKLTNVIKQQVMEAAKVMAVATPAAQTEIPPTNIPAIPAADLPAAPGAPAAASREGPAVTK